MMRVTRRALYVGLWIFGVGCTSIHQIGSLGPLTVYSIKETDFFGATRLLLVVDEHGHAVAAAGGTVAGPGPIAAGLAGSVVVGAGMAYAGHAVGAGLRGIHVDDSALKVRGTVTLVPEAP